MPMNIFGYLVINLFTTRQILWLGNWPQIYQSMPYILIYLIYLFLKTRLNVAIIQMCSPRVFWMILNTTLATRANSWNFQLYIIYNIVSERNKLLLPCDSPDFLGNSQGFACILFIIITYLIMHMGKAQTYILVYRKYNYYTILQLMGKAFS